MDHLVVQGEKPLVAGERRIVCPSQLSHRRLIAACGPVAQGVSHLLQRAQEGKRTPVAPALYRTHKPAICGRQESMEITVIGVVPRFRIADRTDWPAILETGVSSGSPLHFGSGRMSWQRE